MTNQHASDCAVHNEPAYPAGPCDCHLSIESRLDQMIKHAYQSSTDAAFDIFQELVERYKAMQPAKMQPCAGRNCGSTDPNLHSAECFEDYEKATGMNRQEPVHGLNGPTGVSGTGHVSPTKPAQEPVAWVEPEFWSYLERSNCGTAYRLPDGERQPLYTTPPAAPVQEPSRTQTKQIVDGLQRCHHPDSQHEFLRTWIRDWTIHKTAQRQWVDLTDEEITALKRNGERYISSQDFARAVLAKSKEKNHG